MRHLPNLICLLRIALIWPILHSLGAGAYERTLGLFLVAAISDGLDGFLAKRFGWTSALGKFLDPLADKLLLMSVFLLAAWIGLVPAWLTAAVVARDLLIGFGALAFRLAFGPLRGRPLVMSKINTLLQLLYILLVVLRAAIGMPPLSVLRALEGLTLLTILFSALGYLRVFVPRALAARGGA